MIEVRQTDVYRRWVAGLRDTRAVGRIGRRIARLANGLFGDVKYFQGIGELRIDEGPGYQIYFVRRGDVVVILLCGGAKSTQAADIRRAVQMAKEISDGN